MENDNPVLTEYGKTGALFMRSIVSFWSRDPPKEA